MGNLSIRNLDDGIMLKLSSLAKGQKISREEYVRRLLEDHSKTDMVRLTEDKYRNLIYTLVDIIQNNTDELTELKRRINLFTTEREDQGTYFDE